MAVLEESHNQNEIGRHGAHSREESYEQHYGAQDQPPPELAEVLVVHEDVQGGRNERGQRGDAYRADQTGEQVEPRDRRRQDT